MGVTLSTERGVGAGLAVSDEVEVRRGLKPFRPGESGSLAVEQKTRKALGALDGWNIFWIANEINLYYIYINLIYLDIMIQSWVIMMLGS